MCSMKERIDNADLQWTPFASFGKAQWQGRIYKDQQGHFAVATYRPDGGKKTVASLRNISDDEMNDLQTNSLYRNPCDAVWRICSLSGAVENGFQCYENEIGERIENSFAAWTVRNGYEGERHLAATIYRDKAGYFAVATQRIPGGYYAIAGWCELTPERLPSLFKVACVSCSLSPDLEQTLSLIGVSMAPPRAPSSDKSN